MPPGCARLWAIGKADGDDREFALAPDGYGRFRGDGFFVVGQSEAGRDWPYAHPGPSDAWAGGRPHTFTIVFGLARVPADGAGRLVLDLVDTHSLHPPVLRIRINDQECFKERMPRGAGDDSIYGHPETGRPHRVEVAIPAGHLRSGDNEIHIATEDGSWVLYDGVGFDAPAGLDLVPPATRTFVDEVRPIRALVERGGRMFQPLAVTLRHFGAEAEATVRVDGATPAPMRLTRGDLSHEILIPAVAAGTEVRVSIESGGQVLAGRTVAVKPVRKLMIYVLAHSHTDIGYTEIQTAVEDKQVQNLVDGIAAARRTAAYPEGARFVWNVEVLWAADLYLRRLSEAQRADFLEAVRKGQVALNGMYLNELTGLCRPEELVRLFGYSTELAARCGVTIDSAMISDVPGYTWATVTAMAHAGIRYFSTAPNYFDRIGDILGRWENRPFWWVGPSGRERVLVWIPYRGYAMSHMVRQMTPQFVDDYQAALDQAGYPYDIAYMRWSGHGDNAVPDPAICEFLKEWNPKYAWPKFRITSTTEAFRAFEARYGQDLPEVRGDWTPYWEDGAGSSASETALNRASSDRLTQAEALWATLAPGEYPKAAFDEAWRSVLLYSEHTWGAWCSVSDPENRMTREQWDVKQGYALAADRQSQDLLARILERPGEAAEAVAGAIDVHNSCSWPRTEVVILPRERSGAGDRVTDLEGEAVPSQRLASGELAFLASDVPPFGASRFTVTAGEATPGSLARAEGNVLENARLRLRLDEKTGGIAELRDKDLDHDFADPGSGETLNDYRFLPGDQLKDVVGNGPVTITVKEKGPLVASLLATAAAPGCRKLEREVRIVGGQDYVELVDVVDKARAPVSEKPGDGHFAQKGGKESVNFAFPFRVPDGQLWLDLPLAAMRPEMDQMPSACKNWFTVGRWAEVANDRCAITWVTVDAPLLQVGGLTARLLGSQSDPAVWQKTVDRTSKIYSWVMNNHWGTNYRAYQEGPVSFRFVLRPRRQRDPAEASRFATGFSQPLRPRLARGPAPAGSSRLRIEPEDVLVTGLKPSDDGRALIVRLFGASGVTRQAGITWGSPKPRAVFLSDTSEKPGAPVTGAVEVPGFGLVTLRAELK